LSDDETVRTEFKGRVHRLKGTAGMLGATGIARLAGAAETALQHNRPVEAVARALNQLAAALNVLREETDIFLATRPKQPAIASLGADKCPDVGAAEIDSLCALLVCQKLEAVNKFSLLSLSLRGLMDKARFDRLHDAIDSLNFQLAANILRDAPGGPCLRLPAKN